MGRDYPRPTVSIIGHGRHDSGSGLGIGMEAFAIYDFGRPYVLCSLQALAVDPSA